MKFFIKVLLFVGVVVFVTSCGGDNKATTASTISSTTVEGEVDTTVTIDGNDKVTTTTTVTIADGTTVKVDKGVLLFQNVSFAKALLIVGAYGEAKKSGEVSSVSQYKKLVSCADHGFTASQKIAIVDNLIGFGSDKNNVSNISTLLYYNNDSTCSSFDYANTGYAGSFTVEVIVGEK